MTYYATVFEIISFCLPRIVCVLQVFEWSVMIAMMVLQKDKEFTAVLLDMKKDGGKKFKRIEIVLICITSIIVIVICFNYGAFILYEDFNYLVANMKIL